MPCLRKSTECHAITRSKFVPFSRSLEGTNGVTDQAHDWTIWADKWEGSHRSQLYTQVITWIPLAALWLGREILIFLLGEKRGLGGGSPWQDSIIISCPSPNDIEFSKIATQNKNPSRRAAAFRAPHQNMPCKIPARHRKPPCKTHAMQDSGEALRPFRKQSPCRRRRRRTCRFHWKTCH